MVASKDKKKGEPKCKGAACMQHRDFRCCYGCAEQSECWAVCSWAQDETCEKRKGD